MNNPFTTHSNSCLPCTQFPTQKSGSSRLHCLFALVGLFVLSIPALAEDIRVRFMRPAPLRQTVSVNTTNVGVFTNDLSLSTNIIGPVTLSVSNLPPNC